jgi:uncharacterized protein (TIGR01777 family)
LIAGGSGFLGSAIARRLEANGHETWLLSRREIRSSHRLHWDGRTQGAWCAHLGGMDAVVNVTGHSLAHWPWTPGMKQRFIDSRVEPARVLAEAVVQARPRPQVFVQTSGINYYGLDGPTTADESTTPASDYLAQLTVAWEAASASVEAAGVRRVVLRNAVVLDARAGMLPIMALPVRLFLGGRLGEGGQAMRWIHVDDCVDALLFLLGREDAHGAYNLIAPTPTSSDQFVRALEAALGRPYWLPAPKLVLRVALGEMSMLVTAGQYSRPRRLEELRYSFKFATIEAALDALYRIK